MIADKAALHIHIVEASHAIKKIQEVESISELKTFEPSPTLGPAPQDENGNYIGPGTATMVVSFTIE